MKSDICRGLEGRKQDLFQVDCGVECAYCGNQFAACQCFDDSAYHMDTIIEMNVGSVFVMYSLLSSRFHSIF